jgi:hypothetical protein
MTDTTEGRDLTRDPTYEISVSPQGLSITCAQSILVKCLANQFIPKITLYPCKGNTTRLAGRILMLMVIGHPRTILLHITVFPTGIATAKPTSRVLTESLGSFTNMLDTKE